MEINVPECSEMSLDCLLILELLEHGYGDNESMDLSAELQTTIYKERIVGDKE